MELLKFRVTNFRSVEDSGWISIGRIGAFIGVNESGKTNLLTPLWKLNPAREGQIQPTSDYPKRMFAEIRSDPGSYWFVCAIFDCKEISDSIAKITGCDVEKLHTVEVCRSFSGAYGIRFPDVPVDDSIPAETIQELIASTIESISLANLESDDKELRDRMLASLRLIARTLPQTRIGTTELKHIVSCLRDGAPDEQAETSLLTPGYLQLVEAVDQVLLQLMKPTPGDEGFGAEEVIAALPKFLYYSNYGNLDSEIYLPHVIQNLARTDLRAKDEAKARTLRVMFSFVGLSPEEIFELGQDFRDPGNPGREATEVEAAEIGEKKRERSILLQSAGAKLTRSFRLWWRQGDYRFRFEADGNHFRIWVADDRRPDEVELESRSTGLQWFLSFYLVFLVESESAHRGAVLLLDEPGLSLHPLAQRDLSEFFEGLAKTNQILYTTHSPFLVDADHLDRARKVYVAPDGTTKATENLREGAEGPGQSGAAYAVHSALNLTVAESLLLGCQPVIVEGASDQHYLTAIKTLLIRSGKAHPKRELVFPPSGGAKTARTVASIVTGRDEVLPFVLLDSDAMGQKAARELRTSLYEGNEGRVLAVGDFLEMEAAEIEDLMPAEFLAGVVDRWLRVPDPDDEFLSALQSGVPIVPQIESWTKKHSLTLQRGWKVELAKRAKQLALIRGIDAFSGEAQNRWALLFSKLED